jgi:hypothetical protein
MKIISLVLLVIGLLLCLAGGFGTHFFIHHVIYDILHAETSGIGSIARGLDNAWYLSFVSIAGSAFVFLGLVFNIIAMFKGKKTQ